jgi:hypothetical protein
MGNVPSTSTLKTPSIKKWGITLRCLSGGSFVCFLVFGIWALVSSLSQGISNDLASFTSMFFILAPAVYSLIVFIKAFKIKKGWAFAARAGGIILWGVVLFAFLLVFGILLGITDSLNCPSSSSLSSSSIISSSSSGSSTCGQGGQAFNRLAYSGIAFLIISLISEVFMGLSAFSKKDFKILLFISSALVLISQAIFAIFTLQQLSSGRSFYVLAFIGSALLLCVNTLLMLFGADQKASPYEEDAYLDAADPKK